MLSITATIVAAALLSACSSTPKNTSALEPAGPKPTPVAEATQQGFAMQERQRLAAQEQAARKTIADQRVVYFEFDRAVLSPQGQELVRDHARYLLTDPKLRLRLEGHADERGTREYNMALGERRAKAIEQALRLQGVAPAQVATVSYGEEKPAVVGADDRRSYAANRRVEFNFLSGSLADLPAPEPLVTSAR
jgi:peptidoglycan-associated lipoprotein